jgi:hypothetical protein
MLFLIDTVPNLFNKFEYFSSYLLRITFASVSIVALISLLTKNGNGERYSRFFIIIGLILPSLIIFNQFLTDLLFYAINRGNLLQNPILYIKFIIGIILFILTLKYSKQTKSNRIQDYGILTSYVGIFLISLILIKTIEPNFIADLNNIPIWETITKAIIGLVIVYLGYCLKNENMKLRTYMILVLISMVIYGLI